MMIENRGSAGKLGGKAMSINLKGRSCVNMREESWNAIRKIGRELGWVPEYVRKSGEKLGWATRWMTFPRITPGHLREPCIGRFT
jgi:hypothetical protein